MDDLPSLRILMVAPQPFFRARGTPFSVLHRIRALLEGGHEVDLVTYPFGEDIEMPGLRIFRSRRVPTVADVKIGPSLPKLALDFPLYRETVRRLQSGEYDVIHSHEEAAFFCVGLARKHHLPHIYDMHSSLPQQLANFGRFNFPPFSTTFRLLEDRVLGTCDGVITICDDLARAVSDKCPDTPHRMIENTADDSRVFPPAGFDVRERWGLTGREVILYTGTFEAYQGLDMLQSAFERVAAERPAAHLLLVGGRPEQVESARRAAGDAGLADRVTLTGTVHPSEIPAYIQAADLIVSPRSSGTNTPLKIYGYMRSDKPVVATDRWTHTQTLSPETAELVPPSPEGLAAGIIRILAEPERGARLAAAARQYADREFSDEAYVDKVLALYRDVFARRAGDGSALIRDAQ